MTSEPLPFEPLLDRLCVNLAKLAALRGDSVADWPAESLRLCGTAGVYHGLSPGSPWSEADCVQCYLKLAAADLATTFIITQYMGACRRILGSSNAAVRQQWIQPLLSGEQFATVGISHLTTSRRHLKEPVLKAIPKETADGQATDFILQGYSPWVTGAPHADLLVVGATLADGREVLVAVPAKRKGVRPSPGLELVGLSSSCTDRVDFEDVEVKADEVLGGPCHDVMSTGVGAGTGGLQTSTLAIGLARAAVDYLLSESSQRTDLHRVAEELSNQVTQLESVLMSAAMGSPQCTSGELRAQANSLVLRCAQAALGAAKGAGYMKGHPAGRWCREALFFLVWSCPQPVVQAHLCELAGLALDE